MRHLLFRAHKEEEKAMSCRGYSGCNMCNKCGKFTELLASMGKRRCPHCGYVPSSSAETVCTQCGLLLPPPMPPRPGGSSQ